MDSKVYLTSKKLYDFLLAISGVRPVFIWGPPGIGKSAIVEKFASDIGYECVSLLGSQLAPEDLIGVPQIVDEFSRFCPQKNIARQDPYVLFIDEFYKSALSQGLNYHIAGRGFLPLGLIEEIRTLLMPPIPWDVKLARWFDEHFQAIEKIRTYSRLNRRQSSTPDIPRAGYFIPEERLINQTFAVILDTSVSMDKKLLAQGLGAIASYAEAKSVSSIRLIFCDAVPYDQGAVSPESLLDRVQVKGGGGTRLQPAIKLIEELKDFPKDGPILIITDGMIESGFTTRRNHAFLMPSGAKLPFMPKGDLFYIK